MKNDAILSLLGLSAKAGKCKSGEFQVETSVKAGKVYAVILARDASNGSKKNYTDMCKYYKVPIYEYGTKEDLGHVIGKEERAAVAILDEGFAKGIIKKVTSVEDDR